MEIKRKLKALDKRMTPTIEAMNVGMEMNRLCDRMKELVNYAEEKIERAKTRGKTIGQQVDEARKAIDKQITDHQTAESEINLADQKEAFDERNRDPGMTTNVDETPGYSDGRWIAEGNDEIPPPEPDHVVKDVPQAKKKAKRSAGAAAKKKKRAG